MSYPKPSELNRFLLNNYADSIRENFGAVVPQAAIDRLVTKIEERRAANADRRGPPSELSTTVHTLFPGADDRQGPSDRRAALREFVARTPSVHLIDDTAENDPYPDVSDAARKRAERRSADLAEQEFDERDESLERSNDD